MAKPDPIASPSHPATSKRTTPERTASKAPCSVAGAVEVVADGDGPAPVDEEGPVDGVPVGEELVGEGVACEPVGAVTVTVTVGVPVPPAPPPIPQDAAVRPHASSRTLGASPARLIPHPASRRPHPVAARRPWRMAPAAGTVEPPR
jgi:hypothetical protein